VQPALSGLSLVFEWTTSPEDDADIIQRKKAEAFKAMCLGCLLDGSIIGVPVPIGYDDVVV
jgi:hypothetical protein